jgi:PAS domain S-box-containing protein
MNTKVSTDTNKEWLIDDVAAGRTATPAQEVGEQAWRILIVDDDVDVHVVTRLALRNVTFLNRPLQLLSAYSGKEAMEVMRATDDIALVLLDVMMETDDAGLRVAKQIRGELQNHMMRVVLRTGQAGQSVENRVIVDYDINDYKSKTDLTTQKLFTTVIASLRAYGSLVATMKSQMALSASLNKFKDLQAALDQHALVSITDADGKITHANDKFCTTAQFPLEQLIGQDHRIINSAYHPKEFMANLWQTIAAGKTWEGEIRNKSKDGNFYWVSSTVVPGLDQEGKSNQYVAVFTDITERKQTESRLQISEARMRRLLEISPIAVSIVRTRDHHLMFSNQSFLEVFKITPEQEKQIDPSHFWQNPQDYKDMTESVLHGVNVINRHLGLQNQEKQPFWVLASFFLLEYQDEPAIMGWYSDVSNVKTEDKKD